MLEYTGWDTMAVLNQRQEKSERDRQRAASDRALRDHFAAAALTGLLCNGDYSMEAIPCRAFTMADAMLRERERTNHDAAPAARASVDSVAPQPTTDADRGRTDKADSRHGGGTGDTHEPVAWAVASGSRRVYDVYDNEGEAVAICLWLRDEENDGSWVTVPLYRSLTLTDAEREAVAWASKKMRLLGDAYDPEHAATLRGLLERTGGGR